MMNQQQQIQLNEPPVLEMINPQLTSTRPQVGFNWSRIKYDQDASLIQKIIQTITKAKMRIERLKITREDYNGQKSRDCITFLINLQHGIISLLKSELLALQRQQNSMFSSIKNI